MRLVAQGLGDLYRQILEDMLAAEPQPDICKGTSAEVLGASFKIIDPRSNLIATTGRKFNYRYMVAEMLWNASVTNEIKYLTYVMPGVAKYVEDQNEGNRDRVAWAYGFSVWQGLSRCAAELLQHPDSRRAVIRVAENPIQGTPPCLVSQQFIIRGGKLHSFVQMRSNDMWRGFPLDAYQFSMYQLILAAALDVEVGSYNHDAVSFHLYERDRLAAAELLISENYGDIQSTMPDRLFLTDLEQHFVLGSLEAGIPTSPALGAVPWLEVYHNKPGHFTLNEFEYLREEGIGVGWK